MSVDAAQEIGAELKRGLEGSLSFDVANRMYRLICSLPSRVEAPELRIFGEHGHNQCQFCWDDALTDGSLFVYMSSDYTTGRTVWSVQVIQEGQSQVFKNSTIFTSAMARIIRAWFDLSREEWDWSGI